MSIIQQEKGHCKCSDPHWHFYRLQLDLLRLICKFLREVQEALRLILHLADASSNLPHAVAALLNRYSN